MQKEDTALCRVFFYIYSSEEAIDGFFASPLGYKYFMYASIK